MNPAFLDTLADIYTLPVPAVQRVAATIAERCALIANRFEVGDVGVPEPIGAHIGAAILAEFGLPDDPKFTRTSR